MYRLRLDHYKQYEFFPYIFFVLMNLKIDKIQSYSQRRKYFHLILFMNNDILSIHVFQVSSLFEIN